MAAPDWAEIRAMWLYSDPWERQQMFAMLQSEGWQPVGNVNFLDGGMPEFRHASDATYFVQQAAGQPLSIGVWKAPAGLPAGTTSMWVWLLLALAAGATVYAVRSAR